MKVSANSLEAQTIWSEVYTTLASFLTQPANIKLFISRKQLNLAALIYTIEQLMGRLVVIRILEDTNLAVDPFLQGILHKHSNAAAQQEQIWDDLLDLFLDLKQSPLIENSEGETWSLSGVDELQIDNGTARLLINNLYRLDFSNGVDIIQIVEDWIKAMSKSFSKGLMGSFDEK